MQLENFVPGTFAHFHQGFSTRFSQHSLGSKGYNFHFSFKRRIFVSADFRAAQIDLHRKFKVIDSK
jgi:hypothetical protein